jgi:hypothetical protein
VAEKVEEEREGGRRGEKGGKDVVRNQPCWTEFKFAGSTWRDLFT